MNKKILLGLVIVLVVVVIIWFGINREDVEGSIKIGWMGPLTGQSAAMGIHGSIAIQVAVNEINEAGGINGRTVELILEDDQYSILKSITAYNKLVNVDGVKIIMTQTYGAMFALVEQAEKDNVILFDSLDCNNKLAGLNSNVICLGIESESISRLLAGYANEQGFQKVGVLYFNSDTFFPYIKDVFIEEFNGIVIAEGYQAGTKDFNSMILKIKESGAEALVLMSYDEGGVAMKQARILGFTGQFLMPGTVTSPILQEAAEGNAEGTVFAFFAANQNREDVKEFTQKFSGISGHLPFLDFATYPAYDAMKVLSLALEDVENEDNVKKIEEFLRSERDLSGLTGSIDFMEDGGARVPFKLYKLQNGIPVLLK